MTLNNNYYTINDSSKSKKIYQYLEELKYNSCYNPQTD